MHDRYADKFGRLRDSVLTTPGALTPELRHALAEGRDTEAALDPYADKVRHHAYKVVDGDIERLLAAGYSEDAVFEATVSVALGAAITRLEAGLDALRGTDESG